jgi:hypothetical protein
MYSIFAVRLTMEVLKMQDIFWGIDVAQLIFAGLMIAVLIGFATWGFRTRDRIKELEAIVASRDFRELEPEGYEEETTVDAFSEGARLEADEQLARERDIADHNA